MYVVIVRRRTSLQARSGLREPMWAFSRNGNEPGDSFSWLSITCSEITSNFDQPASKFPKTTASSMCGQKNGVVASGLRLQMLPGVETRFFTV